MRTGTQAGVYSFNRSRLDTILKARTLDEAQRMGFFDKLLDKFRGGPKREAIRQLYDSISVPSASQSEPSGMLQRFHKLRDMASAENRGLFEVACAPPNEAREWGFSFSIAGQPVFASAPGMRDEAATPFQPFEAAARTDRQAELATRLAERIALDQEAMLSGRTVDTYALGAVDFVSDQPEVRAFLKSNLENPLFSKDNFTEIKDGDTPDTFKAVFSSHDGARAELVLSNRAASQGEYRGEVLKEALSSSSYESLKQLFGSSFNTPNDRNIAVLARSGLARVNAELNEIDGTNATAHERLEALSQLDFAVHPGRVAQAVDSLSAVRLGNTNLLEVLLKDRAGALMMGEVLEQLKAEPVDAISALRAAVNFGNRVYAAAGDDGEASALQRIVRQGLEQIRKDVGTEGVERLLATLKKHPELGGMESAIQDRIQRVVSAEDIDPGTPELLKLFTHTRSARYGAQALGLMVSELERMLMGPPDNDRILNAAPELPATLRAFIELHVGQRMSIEQTAEQLAASGGAAQVPIDPRFLA